MCYFKGIYKPLIEISHIVNQFNRFSFYKKKVESKHCLTTDCMNATNQLRASMTDKRKVINTGL